MSKIKQKREQKFKEDGITLLALVVTIVILLVLAQITITSVIGENGLITKSRYAKFINQYSLVEETVVNQIYSMSTGYDGSNLYFRENDSTYTNAITGTLGKPSSSTVFAIGTNPNGTSQELGSSEARFNIEVYSVRIYNRCLTEEEINQNYQIDKARFGI